MTTPSFIQLPADGSGKKVQSWDNGSLGHTQANTLVDSSGTEVAVATETTLQSILSSVDGLEGFVDGVEDLITATNSALSTLNANVDGLEGYTDGIESLLTQIRDYVDTVETLIGTTNSTLSTVDGHVDGLEGLITALNGYVDGLEGLLSGTITVAGAVTANLGTLNGAATEAKQDTANTHLATIEGKLDTLHTDLSGGISVSVGEVEVKNDSGNPVPVSGTFYPATQPVSAASLPLPSGAATSANQTTANSSLSSIDGKLPSVAAADRTTAAAPHATRLSDGTSFYKPTTPTDTQPISASSLPLPSGAATSANQTTANSSLSSIDGKLPTSLVSGRLDVNIGNTPTVTANAGTNLNTSALALESGGNLAAIKAKTDNIPTSPATDRATAAAPFATRLSDGTNFYNSPASTQLPNALGANGGLKIEGVANGTTVPVLGTIAGDVAHAGADSGNPVKIGAKAASALSTATMVSNAQRTNLVSDLDGAIIVRSSRPLGDIVTERVSNTDGASTAFTNFSAVASTRNVITGYSVFNSSSSTGYLDFRDGTTGAVLWTVPLPANGGANFALPDGIFRTSANTALAYDVSAALTTVYISVTGFKSKV